MRYLPIFSIGLFLFISTPGLSLAQGGNAVNPPNRVQANFNAKFPDHSGATQWQETSDGYQATLRKSNNEVVSNFDKDGRWVKSRTALKENDLPKNTKKYIGETYKQYNFQEGYRYETKTGTRYETKIRSENKAYRLEFDSNGGFVKEEPLNGNN